VLLLSLATQAATHSLTLQHTLQHTVHAITGCCTRGKGDTSTCLGGGGGEPGHTDACTLGTTNGRRALSQLPYFQDTLQYEMYGQHGKAGYDEFKELVENDKLSMARDTPYYQDTWQYGTYGSGGRPMGTKRLPQSCESTQAKS